MLLKEKSPIRSMKLTAYAHFCALRSNSEFPCSCTKCLYKTGTENLVLSGSNRLTTRATPLVCQQLSYFRVALTILPDF